MNYLGIILEAAYNPYYREKLNRRELDPRIKIVSFNSIIDEKLREKDSLEELREKDSLEESFLNANLRIFPCWHIEKLNSFF